MASRYDNNQQEATYTGSASASNESSSSRSRSTTTTRSSTSENISRMFDIDTMSTAGRQAQTQLLAELLAGGTEEQRRREKERLELLQTLQAQAQDYSRETALADAEGLMQQVLRQALEQSMPSILQAQAGAGSSGDAITALLSQDLATRASQASATAGVGAVADYGNILAQLLGQQGSLVTDTSNSVTEALLQALAIDRGSVKRGTETENRTSSTRSRSTTTSSQESMAQRMAASTGVSSSNRGDVSVADLIERLS